MVRFFIRINDALESIREVEGPNGHIFARILRVGPFGKPVVVDEFFTHVRGFKLIRVVEEVYIIT